MEVTDMMVACVASVSVGCTLTKSFFRILAARKLEREQKIDKAEGGGAPSATSSSFLLSLHRAARMRTGTLATQANMTAL